MKFPVLLLCGFLYAAASALPSGIDLLYKTLDKKPVRFPYVAIVLYGDFKLSIMSGAIISPSWVLTLIDSNFEEHILELGAGAQGHVQVRRPAEVVLHPDESIPLALIKVEAPFKFDESVQPIALPHPDNEGVGEAVASGWVEKEFLDVILPITIPVLESVNLTAITNKECGDKLKLEVPKKVLCAIQLENSYDSTFLGGPLVQNGVLLGITDYTLSTPNGQKDVIKPFVRVTAALDFIKKYVTDL